MAGRLLISLNNLPAVAATSTAAAAAAVLLLYCCCIVAAATAAVVAVVAVVDATVIAVVASAGDGCHCYNVVVCYNAEQNDEKSNIPTTKLNNTATN